MPGRDGIPYCEADYHSQFGIRCDSCNRYISGRVLEVSAVFPCEDECVPETDGIGGECGRCSRVRVHFFVNLCTCIQVLECVYKKLLKQKAQLSLLKQLKC